MNCADARAAHLAGLAGPEHRDHLATCPACKPLADDLEAVGAMLDDESLWEEPAEDLEERIVGLIAGGRRDEGRGRTYSSVHMSAA